jgi:uncharacterized protein YjlB
MYRVFALSSWNRRQNPCQKGNPHGMKSPRKLYFEKGNDVPNSTLPALLFRSVLGPSANRKAQRFRHAFKTNGWVGLWTDTIYDYTHFHSNAHEVLGIAEGKVTVLLGGEKGRQFRLKAGDMLVIPAGVAHRRIGDDAGLKVIGAYPPGQSHFNMKRRGRTMPKVALPSEDPFYGEDGPVVRLWHHAAQKR